MPSLEQNNKELPEEKDKAAEPHGSAGENGMNALDLLREKSVKKEDSKGFVVPDLTLTDEDKEIKMSEAEKPDSNNKDENKEKQPEKQKSKNEKVKEGFKHFGQGLATGIALQPINGFTQLLNHIFHTKIPEIKFKNQKEVDSSIAGKIGSFAGDALVTVASGGAAKAVGLGSKAAQAATAAVREGVLSPTEDKEKDGAEFWKDRLSKAATAGAQSVPTGKLGVLAENTMRADAKTQDIIPQIHLV